jgi:hypothetical protein
MNVYSGSTIPAFSRHVLLSVSSPVVSFQILVYSFVTILVYAIYPKTRTNSLAHCKLYILPTESICVFHMVLTINSDCFPDDL